eukprot:34589-Hanusia_phi.AAC.1
MGGGSSLLVGADDGSGRRLRALLTHARAHMEDARAWNAAEETVRDMQERAVDYVRMVLEYNDANTLSSLSREKRNQLLVNSIAFGNGLLATWVASGSDDARRLWHKTASRSESEQDSVTNVLRRVRKSDIARSYGKHACGLRALMCLSMFVWITWDSASSLQASTEKHSTVSEPCLDRCYRLEEALLSSCSPCRSSLLSSMLADARLDPDVTGAGPANVKAVEVENKRILVVDSQTLTEQEPTAEFPFHVLRPELQIQRRRAGTFEESYITVGASATRRSFTIN